MPISPAKGMLIKAQDTSPDSKVYDDILGKFRQSLVAKAQDVIQYHRDNIRKGNKPFVGVGFNDKVNSDPGEGTWVFSGFQSEDTIYDGRHYDLYYVGFPVPTNPHPIDDRIPIKTLFNKKEIEFREYVLNGYGDDNYYGLPEYGEGTGEAIEAPGDRIYGEKSGYEMVHYNENGRITGYGPPVEEGEFGQAAPGVFRDLAKYMHIICGVRKAQFDSRMSTTDLDWSVPRSVNYLGNTVNINSNSSLKQFIRWYNFKKIDTFRGWGTFNPIYFSSTDNNAWEIMKRITNGDIVAGERLKPGWVKTVNGISVEAPGQSTELGPDPNHVAPGQPGPTPPGGNNPGYPSYPGDKNGKVITAENVQTILTRMEDLWRDFANATGRAMFVVIDYCHTSCHASCHSTQCQGHMNSNGDWIGCPDDSPFNEHT